MVNAFSASRPGVQSLINVTIFLAPRVPWKWVLLKVPRFGGAKHANDQDNRSGYRKGRLSGHALMLMAPKADIEHSASESRSCEFTPQSR
jgi:hypothetical protein